MSIRSTMLSHNAQPTHSLYVFIKVNATKKTPSKIPTHIGYLFKTNILYGVCVCGAFQRKLVNQKENTIDSFDPGLPIDGEYLFAKIAEIWLITTILWVDINQFIECVFYVRIRTPWNYCITVCQRSLYSNGRTSTFSYLAARHCECPSVWSIDNKDKNSQSEKTIYSWRMQTEISWIY